MNKKSDIDLEITIATAAVRSAIRQKYSALAAREINERVPEIVNAMKIAAVQGKPYRLNLSSVFAEGE